MTSYRFDLYPRTDPRDGTLIRSFTSLQKAAYRAEANGVSTGQIELRSTTDDGQAIDPLGLQYVRVVELPGGSVRGGFFLERGKFAALSEDEDSLLKFSGSGTDAYLSRAVMAPHTYLDYAIGTDPLNGVWNLWNMGPAAGGDKLGAILHRVVYEAQHYRVALTEHRHADGVIYTDSHPDDDRSSTAIPAVVMTFTQFQDSSGNAWTKGSGEFKAMVGENLLAVVHRLREAGLYVELDPDTFELNAWEQGVHRAMLDATGTAWGTGVVRFQSPTDGTLATGNIKDDAERKIEAFIKRSVMWAGGSEVYGVAAASGSPIPWEGFYRADLGDVAALQAVADVQLDLITDAGDVLKLRLWMEDDPGNGHYVPFQHVKLDQLVTVHTGTDQWEFNERTFPVSALSLNLTPGGGWDCFVELGGTLRRLPSPTVPRQPAAPTPVGPVSPEDENHAVASGNDFAVVIEPVAGEGLVAIISGGWVSDADADGVTADWCPDYVSPASPGDAYPMTRIYRTSDSEIQRIIFFALSAPGTPPATVSTARVIFRPGGNATGVMGSVVRVSDMLEITPTDTAYGNGTGTLMSAPVTVDAGGLVIAGGCVYFGSGTAPSVTPANLTAAWSGDTSAVFEEKRHVAGYGTDGDPEWTLGSSQPWKLGVVVIGGTAATGGDTTEPIGEDGSPGTSPIPAPIDHIHAHGLLSTSETHYHDGGQIEGGVGMANPMTTQGDVIYGGSSGAASRLGIGTVGQVLKVNAGATAPEWAAESGGGGGGATIAGLAPYATIPGFDYRGTDGTYAGTADQGRMVHILVPAPMYLRALRMYATAAGSGTHQWGLFDASADATAAVKVAGGSGTVGVGWTSIAATSAPVQISAGAYILIWKWPAANRAAIQYRLVHPNTAGPLVRSWSGSAYTWDDTPDLTAAGWVDDASIMYWLLVGDMDASGNQW